MFGSFVSSITKYLAMALISIAGIFGITIGTDYDPGMQLYADTYPNVILETLWLEYRDAYIQKDGRTIDRNRDYVTTSEGQSYGLLKAVLMDDKPTFDKVLRWSNNNLRKRPSDRLYAWQWGQDSEGGWGIMESMGGLNSATDSDQDIALALLMAYKRWNDPYYNKEAIKLLSDIWDHEVVIVNDRPYLVAGNWATEEEFPTINPSYYSMAAYPLFAEADPEHDWLALRDTSYDVLFSLSSEYEDSPLNSEFKGVLPPDWIALDPINETLVLPLHADKTTNFSDDAIRVPWRVALDYKWNRYDRAFEYLKTMDKLKTSWEENNSIYSEYDAEGNIVNDWETNSTYGATIGYFSVIEPEIARQIYIKKIISLYDRDAERFYVQNNLGYYDENWVWFGIALYQDQIPNLYKIIESKGDNYAE